MTSQLHRYKTLFNWFPYISYTHRADGSILMQPRNSFLYNLCNGNCFADCLTHCLQHNLFDTFLLKQSGGVGDVVPDEALCGNTDLVLVYWGFRLRFLNPLVSIHGYGSKP